MYIISVELILPKKNILPNSRELKKTVEKKRLKKFFL